MNKIVEHYPASKLPEELCGTIAANASVKVTIEEENIPEREKLMKLLHNARRNVEGVTLDEAVRRVRELRDEWDD